MGTNDGDQESKLYSQDLNNGDPKSEMRDQDSNDDAPQSGMHDQGSEQENSYDGNTASYDSYEPVPDEDTYTEYKDQSGYPAYDNRHPALNRTLSPGTTSVFSFMESLKSNQANQADQ